MTPFDNSSYRALFPAVSNSLYLDAAHQTPLSIPVKNKLDEFYGSALENAGPKAGWLDRVEEVRGKLAGFMGTEPQHIAFTKNTSEGLNICANGVGWASGDNVLLLEGEHPNNAYAWLGQRSRGVEVRFVPNDKAWADAETFAPYIDKRTRAIGISHVMFHSGQRNDIASIVELCAAQGIKVIVDAMQSVGLIPLHFDKLGAAAVASGTHKGLLTPQGLGFLYTADEVSPLSPTYVALAGVANSRPDLVADAGAVELHRDAHRFEIGNFNLPAIYALGGALELLEEVGVATVEAHVMALGDRLISGAEQLGVGLVGPTDPAHRSPHIYVLQIAGDGWADFFRKHNVRVSPVRDGTRVSLGLYNDQSDIDQFLELLDSGTRTLARSAA